jgi:hypothetical protein
MDGIFLIMWKILCELLNFRKFSRLVILSLMMWNSEINCRHHPFPLGITFKMFHGFLKPQVVSSLYILMIRSNVYLGMLKSDNNNKEDNYSNVVL